MTALAIVLVLLYVRHGASALRDTVAGTRPGP
jgi:hypothetical protein